MNIQNKKFISPGAWFSLVYPSNWNEFEDMEGSFLFYNPNKWAGNFRISAFKAENGEPGSTTYGEDCIKEELKRNQSAEAVDLATWKCAYYKETFQEEGVYYTTHIWITGKRNIAFECSFTVPKGGDKKPAEEIMEALQLREENRKYPLEVIPARVLEIGVINEAYGWASSTVKKLLKKDFTAIAEDIPKIQQAMQAGNFKSQQKEAWQSLGIAFGAILVNEIDGMQWVTAIDGSCEYPALRYEDSEVLIYPMQLIGEKMGKGQVCNLPEEFDSIKTRVENIL